MDEKVDYMYGKNNFYMQTIITARAGVPTIHDYNLFQDVLV